MPDQTLRIHLNLAALWSNYFVRLQHLLDAASFLQAGAAVVTEEQVEAQRVFMAFHPAGNSRLPQAEVTAMAQDWVTRSFLRDSIELTGLFLDECLSTCGVLQLAAKGNANGAEVQRVLNDLPLRNHRLHFPEKLATLERDFGVRSRWVPHVLSINRARTCVVHRLGAVSVQDVGANNELVVNWCTTQMWAREIDSGKKIPVDQPGILIEKKSMLEMHFVEHERRFSLGSQITLTPYDLYSTIITLWLFGTSNAEAIEAYARDQGLVVDAPEKSDLTVPSRGTQEK
jgi:hypothetical protein